MQWNTSKLGIWRLCKECHIPNGKIQYESSQPTAPHADSYTYCRVCVYTNYKPHLLKDDVFPFPPVGYEYFEIKTPAHIEDNDGKEVDPDGKEKLGYEVCNWKPQLNEILVHRDIVNS